MSKVIKASWANAIETPDFICIETYSGYGSTRLDPKGVQHIVQTDIENSELGALILDALSHSRFVLPEPRPEIWVHPETIYDPTLYDKHAMSLVYSDWITNLMSRFGYKNKKELFKHMKSCSIRCLEQKIIISPSNHDRLEGWSGLMDTEDVMIKEGSIPFEIGAALRLAFSRCKG